MTTNLGMLDEKDMFSVPIGAPVWHTAAHRDNEDIQAKNGLLHFEKSSTLQV